METPESDIKEALFEEFGLSDISLFRLSGYYDQNFKVTAKNGTFFLKIYGFDKLPAVLFQLDFMAKCTEAGFPVARLIKSKRGEAHFHVGDRAASLQEFLPGIPVAETEANAGLMEELGATLGQMHRLVSSQELQGEKWKKYPWDLSQFDLVFEDFRRVRDALPKGTVAAMEQLFADWNAALPELALLRKGAVHNDYHAKNVLVLDKEVSAVTDFGDAMYTWYAADVGIAVAHLCFRTLDKAELFSKAFLRGHEREFPLNDLEKKYLPLLIRMRAVCVIVQIADDSRKLRDAMYDDMVRLQTSVLEFLSRSSLRLFDSN